MGDSTRKPRLDPQTWSREEDKGMVIGGKYADTIFESPLREDLLGKLTENLPFWRNWGPQGRDQAGEGTGTCPDYLVNRVLTKNEGPHPKTFVRKSRNSCTVNSGGVGAHGQLTRSSNGLSPDSNTNAQRILFLSCLLRSPRYSLVLLELPAQFLIGSPGTLRPGGVNMKLCRKVPYSGDQSYSKFSRGNGHWGKKEKNKNSSWYSARGPGRMSQTPQAFTGDSASRFRRSRCSTLFNYDSYFPVVEQFCFQLLLTT